MKNLSYLACLLLAFLSVSINAQDTHFEVIESEKYNDQFKSTEVLSIHTNNENVTLVTRKSGNNLVFESFDENAKGLKIKTQAISRKEGFVADLFYDNKLQIFTLESPSKTERIVYCYTYSLQGDKIEKTTLISTTVERKGKLFSGENKRQTNFAISPNNKFIAIATDNVKKNSNSYNIHLFDAETLSLIYTKSYYSNPDQFYTSSDMVVDNDGVIFNIGKEYAKGRRERKNDKANYSYVLCKIDETTVNFGTIELTEDEYIQNLNMSFYQDKLRLIGYYSQDKVFGIKGVSDFKVDKNTLTVSNKKKEELPLTVFEDLYGYRKAGNKKNSELTSFDLDYILEDDEGNTFLIAEEFYITQTYVSTGMNGGGYMMTTYHYDDILITKLDANGKLVWGRSIFKRSNMPSYNAFLNNNKVHIVLNSGKNLLEKNDGRLKVSKGFLESTALYVFLYDKDGNVVHEKIQDNKGKTKYIPFKGNYNDGKFLMYNHSANKKQVMMLECKD